jgi:diguanylate cyclase (GGDEF)-like protein/PAS domain S-box-containing protein
VTCFGLDKQHRLKGITYCLGGAGIMNQDESNLSALIHSTRDFIWSVNCRFELVAFNRAYQQYLETNFGTRPSIGMRPRDLTPPARAERWPLLYGRALSEGTFSMESTRADGRTTQLTFNRIEKDGRTTGVSVFGRDITDLKAAEARAAAAQEALRLSEERYRTAFQTSLDAININRLDDGMYVECNKAFLDITGFDRSEVIGKTSQELKIWADSRDRRKLVEAVGLNSNCRDLQAQFRRRNGDIFWGLMSASLIEINGSPCILSITRDVTESKLAEEHLAASVEALRLSEERYRTVFQTSFDGIFINRLSNGACIDVNPKFLEFMGYERDEVLGKTTMELNLWTNTQDRTRLFQLLEKNESCHGFEAQFRKKNGEATWAQLSVSRIEIDRVPCLITIARDVSNEKAAEDEIRTLAFYDPLTGLPNRRLVFEQLRQSQTMSSRFGFLRALLFLDLDNFKTLNDTLGHQTGDLLLQEVARRLSSCVRETDIIGRFGGDEFVIILQDLSGTPERAAEQAKNVAEKIRAVVNQPYLLDGRNWISSSSIGIAVFGDKRESTDEILQQADIAMYQAKAAGRNTIHFFAPALQAAVSARAAMEEDLRRALDMSEFLLYYQPQLNHGRLIGAEALVRWKHPHRGLLTAGEFIPLAEETGLIVALGDWVLGSACRQITAWAERKGTASIFVSVNVSSRQFRQPDFVEHLLSTLDRTKADPQSLVLEITESVLVDNFAEVLAKMETLKSHGVRFSLDDFGTGYSSLSYLKRLPVDQLKIDYSFVRDMLVDAAGAAIAEAIISLGRAMKLQVIAEGVETVGQRDFLASLGCHSFQGYLFSHPLPVEEFDRLPYSQIRETVREPLPFENAQRGIDQE